MTRPVIPSPICRGTVCEWGFLESQTAHTSSISSPVAKNSVIKACVRVIAGFGADTQNPVAPPSASRIALGVMA